jgi:hypothetical protein
MKLPRDLKGSDLAKALCRDRFDPMLVAYLSRSPVTPLPPFPGLPGQRGCTEHSFARSHDRSTLERPPAGFRRL